MNQGKRYLRNTVLTAYGALVVFVGMNRLHASVVDADTPTWLRSAMTLGLREEVEPEPRPEMDLATAKDFTRVVMTGRYDVEIIGAAHYKVTFVPAAGDVGKLHASQADGVLHLHAERNDGEGEGESEGNGEGTAGTIQIETPALQQVHARVNHLTIRGMQGDTLQVTGMGRGDVTLLQNQVANWRLTSGAPMQVRVDDATFAAGSLKGVGDVVIRRAQ